MKTNKNEFANYLQAVFVGRKSRNSRYSLRAYARDLGLSPSKMSEMLSGKYAPGPGALQSICNSLKLNETESNHLKELAMEYRTMLSEQAAARVLGEDELAMIVDLEHYSVLSLMKTDTFYSEPKWIAQRLGLTVERVHEVIERLQRLDLVKFEDGQYRHVHEQVTTSHNIPSEALRMAHRQVIDHARECLSLQNDLRDITSITFAVNTDIIPEIKKILRDCRRRIAQLAESGRKEEVYNLNFQLVPVTKQVGT